MMDESERRETFQACKDVVWALVKILNNFKSSSVLRSFDQIEKVKEEQH